MTPSTFERTLASAKRTMLLSEIVRLAIDSFRASKVRFMLTALGMVIGSASLILVVTIGLTGKQFILNELQSIGTNMVELEYSGGGAGSLASSASLASSVGVAGAVGSVGSSGQNGSVAKRKRSRFAQRAPSRPRTNVMPSNMYCMF